MNVATAEKKAFCDIGGYIFAGICAPGTPLATVSCTNPSCPYLQINGHMFRLKEDDFFSSLKIDTGSYARNDFGMVDINDAIVLATDTALKDQLIRQRTNLQRLLDFRTHLRSSETSPAITVDSEEGQWLEKAVLDFIDSETRRQADDDERQRQADARRRQTAMCFDCRDSCADIEKSCSFDCWHDQSCISACSDTYLRCDNQCLSEYPDAC